MRKALFAVVLVSASFAGGAVANGPGFRWAQAMVLERLGIEGEEDDDGGHAATAGTDAPKSTSTPSPSQEPPARPIPPLVLGSIDAATTTVAARRPAAPAQEGAPSASVLPTLAPVPEAPPRPDPIPPLSASLDPAMTEPETPRPAAEQDKDNNKVKTADADADKPKGQNHEVDSAVRRASAELVNDLAARYALRDEVDSAARRASAGAPDPADAAPAGDWAAVRETMRGLGVTRYGIEGDPSGRVRFYCVIPVAGRRAVGQHFEAEGDDDLQAARAALKRVALWKATEGGETDTP